MSVAARDSISKLPLLAPRGDPIAAALRHGRIHDGVGHQIHTFLAMLFLGLLPISTAPKDFAFGLLLIWTLIRLPHIWRSFSSLCRQPVVITIVAWAGFFALSMAWSPDAGQGFDEFGAFRVLVIPLLLWPILDRVAWLIGAALLGVFAHNLIQLLQVTAILPMTPGDGDRIRGFVHPGKGGAWCAAAVVWHLFALINARGWFRWVSLVLLIMAGLGLAASGSRGAWLSLAVAMPLALVVTAVRRPSARPVIGAVTMTAILLAIALWPMVGTSLKSRVDETVAEAREAREQGVYWSSSGLRIALWGWAVEIFRQYPLAGAGAGGFSVRYAELPLFHRACEGARDLSLREVAGARLESPTRTDEGRAKKLAERRIKYMSRDHAHSTYLHTLAQQGVVGMALLVCAMGAIVVRAWKDRFDHPYAGAALFVLVSWMVGAQFDCYELNGNQLGLLAVVVASVMPRRAAVRLQLRATDSSEVRP